MFKPKPNKLKTEVSIPDTSTVFFERMEPKILLSADALSGLVASDPFNDDAANTGLDINESVNLLSTSFYAEADTSNQDTYNDDLLFGLISDNQEINNSHTELDVLSAILDVSESDSASRQEIIFIDASTPDYDELLSGIDTNAADTDYQIFILQSDRDGVEQITEILGRFDDVDAVHLVSHGNEQGVQLGDTWLGQDSLSDYAESISAWTNVLDEEADILIYGCNLAATESGQEFLSELAKLTDADVAASDDLTGAATLGGDWELEQSTGVIDSSIAFTESFKQSWMNVLVSGNYVDDFNTVAYNNSSGSLDWSTEFWQETGDDDDPAAGDVLISGDALVLKHSGGGQDRDLWGRDADLTGAAKAALEYDYSITGDSGKGGTVDVFVWDGLGWITVATYDLTTSVGSTTESLDVSAYANQFFAVDFKISAGGSGTNATFTLDNVTISASEGSNYAPVATNLNSTSDYNTGEVAVSIDDIKVKDADSGDIITATLTLADTSTGGLSANDGATYDSGTGVWTITDTVANVNQALANLEFNPVITNTLDTTISVVIDDDDEDLSGPLTGTINLNVVPVTFAPVLDLDADDSSGATGVDFQTTYVELNPPVNITDSDVSLTDIDSANLVSVTVTLTNDPDGVKEALAADDVLATSLGLTVDWDFDANVITISGPGTVADYQSVLSTVTYDNTKNNPTTTPRVIEIVADDGTNTSVIATTTVSVVIAGNVPVANDDTFTVDEGSMNNIFDLVVNDTDADGDLDLASITIVSGPTNGTITAINADGTVEYTHDGSETTTDSFTYTINDLIGSTSNVATVALTINPVNDVPLASDDAYTTNEDTALTAVLGVDDLLQNDSDPDVDTLTVNTTPITNVSNGTLILNADGTFTYTPSTNFNGSDSFTYEVSDGNGGTAQATVTITVNPVNDIPLITTNNPLSLPEESTRTITSAYLEATDPDNMPSELVYTITDTPNGAAWLRLSGSTLGIGDTFTQQDINDGLVRFSDDEGPTNNNFKFTVSDGVNTSGEITFFSNAAPVNDAPVNTVPAAPLAVVESTQTPVVGISVADVDAGASSITTQLSVTNGVLDVTLSGMATISAGTNGSNTLTINGTVTDINATLSSLQYTGNAGVSGISADTLTVVTNDQGNTGSGGALSDTDNVQFDITPANNVPVAVDDAYTTSEDTALTAVLGVDDLLLNDSDPDSDPLTVNTTPVVDVTDGTLVLNADGTFTYTPNANFNGTDSFTYEVNDGNGGTAQATVTITVDPVNDIPVAVDDAYTTNEDTALTAVLGTDDLLLNDSDVDGDTLSVSTTPVANVSNGTLTLNANGTFTYTPNANFNGTDSFTYEVNDGNGGTAQATVTITVTAVNDAPTAPSLNSTSNYNEGDVTVAITDIIVSDVDSGEIITATLTLTDTSTGSLSANDGATYNSVTGEWIITDSVANVNQALANLVFNPNTDNDLNTTISVSIDDGDEDASGPLTGTINLNVTAVNDVPVATANTVSTNEDTALAFAAADFTFTDVEGDSLVSAKITNLLLAGGTLTHSGSITVNDGDTLTAAQLDTLVYIPASNANGAPLATFDFTVNDADLGVTSAQMSIDVTAVSDAPFISTNNLINVAEQSTVTITSAYLEATDMDNTPAEIVYTITSLPTNAFVRLSGSSLGIGSTFTQDDINSGLVTFEDNAGPTNNSFQFTVSDGMSTSGNNTFSINTTPVNDAPVNTVPGTQTVVEDTQTLIAGISVADIDAGSSDITTQLSVTNGVLDVTLSGAATISAGSNGSNTLTINGTVTEINATLSSLKYTGNTNVDGVGADTLSVVTNDLGNTGAGGALSDTDNVQIDITPVNDVPVATVNTVTTTEDNAYTFAASDFTFSDVESDALVSATITNLSLASGTLEHSGGTPVTDGMTLTAAQLDTLVYTPTGDANGASLATFDFTVNDADLGVTTAQMDIDVTAVNDVPVATVNTVTTTEDNAYTFAASDFTFTDVEGNALVSATITNLSLAGGTLEHSSGTTVTNGMTLTAAQLDTLVYTPAGDANGTPLATFDFTVNDADLGVTTAQMDIDVTAVNDAPVATVNTVTTTEDNAYTFAASDFTFTDVESDALVSATITNLSLASGTLEHSGGTPVTDGMILTAAQLDTLVYTPAGDANGAPLATFDFTVNDADSGVTTAQMDIDVTAVNDAPVASAHTVSTTEDIAYTFAASDFTFSDVESDALVSSTITNLSLGGGTLVHSGSTTVTNGMTLTAAELDTLIYTPPASTNGAPLATFDFTVNDADLGVTTAQMDIDVTPFNDVPVAIANTVTTTEDNAYSFAATDFTFSDVESDALVSATITNLSLGGGTLVHSGSTTVTNGMTLTTAQLDTLVYTPAGDANGAPLATFDFTVNDAGSGVTTAQMDIDVTAVNDVPVATVNTVTTTEDNAYTFAASDFTFSDVEGGALVSATITNLSLAGGTLEHSGGTTVTNGMTLTAAQLDTLVYTPSGDANGAPLATFDFTVNDAGVGVTTAQMDIDVTAVNDAPTVANIISNQVATEDAPFSFTFAANTFNDVDVGDTLTYTSDASGWLSFDAATRTFSGTPLNGDVGTTTVTVTADDGNGGTESDTFDIVISNTNDAPTATNLNSTSSYDQADATVAITDITVGDVDSAETITATLTLADTGTGSLSANNGASYNAATGVWTITGSAANVNLALGNLVFNPNINNILDTTIDVSIDDGDEDASGPLTGTINLDVTPAVVIIGPAPDPDPDPEPSPGPGGTDDTPPTADDDVPVGVTVNEETLNATNEVVFDPSTFTGGIGARGVLTLPALLQLDDGPAERETIIIRDDNTSTVRKLDTAVIDRLRSQFTGFDGPLQLVATDAFISKLNDVREEIVLEDTVAEMVVGGSMSLSAGLSVGYAIWLARSGVLMSGLLSSMPAWAFIDPLPVLASMRTEDDEDDESLESMVEDNNENDENKDEEKDEKKDKKKFDNK